MHHRRSLGIAAVLILGLAACETATPTLSDRPAPGDQGLYMLDNAPVRLAAARPNIDWGSYDRIVISDLVVPDEVLNATPANLSQRGRTSLGESWVISRADGQRLTNEFTRQVTREFQNGGEFQVTQDPGPGTLVLRTQLTNITLTAPIESSRPAGNRRTFTGNAGSLTIAGELVDGQTGEVLAQFADNRMTSNNTWQVNNRVTNFADATRIFRQWGVLLRGALLSAQAGEVPPSATG